MSTFTASLQFSPNLKAVHTGIVAVGSRTSICATGTAASVLLLGNVPNGATLVDWWAHIITAGADQTVQIGTSNSPSGIAALFSLTQCFSLSPSAGGPTLLRIVGATNSNDYRAPQGDRLPVRISLSDDVQPTQVMVQAVLGTAISASALFSWMLFYTMDGTVGNTTIR